MCKKIIKTMLLITFAICSLMSQTIAIKPTGSGIESNPYLISNLAHLRWMSEHSEEWWIDLNTRVHFLQTANIDATETIYWNEGSGFRPIGHAMIIHGNLYNRFIGEYDGGDNVISNLSINSTFYPDTRWTTASLF